MIFRALELEGLIEGLFAFDVAVCIGLLLLGWKGAAIIGRWLAILRVRRLLVAVAAIVVAHGVLLLGLLSIATVVVVVCFAVVRHCG